MDPGGAAKALLQGYPVRSLRWLGSSVASEADSASQIGSTSEIRVSIKLIILLPSWKYEILFYPGGVSV